MQEILHVFCLSIKNQLFFAFKYAKMKKLKGVFMRRHIDDMDRKLNIAQKFADGGRLYKLLATIAMVGIFVAAGIIVLAATQVLKISPGLFGTAVMIGILSLALISILPWIRRIENNEYKTVSIAFVSVIAVCAVLWIISDWLVVAMITNHNAGVALLWFVKIAIILSLQLMVADVVAVMYLRFKKSYMPFQIITYLSYGFIDFYLTFLLCCINIADGKIKVSNAFGLLGSHLMIALIALAVVYAAISSSILRFIQERRKRNMVNDYYEGKIKNLDTDEEVQEKEEPKEEPKETPEQKLEKLKKLYDQELITKEDYEAKKAEIMKEL